MKRILTIYFFTICTIANAQVNFPIDSSTKKISINKVVQLDSTSKKEIYNRAKDFIITAFRSANDVIQLDNYEDGKIIAKGFSEFIGGWTFGNALDGKVWFTLIIQIKDNKYRYEITNIFHEGYPGKASYGVLENELPRIRILGWSRKVCDKFRKSIYVDLIILKSNLEKQLNKPTSAGVKDF